MPYLKPEDRPQWKPVIDALVDKIKSSSGKLRYLLHVVALKVAAGQRYSDYERAYGFLGCLKQEFDRRLCSRYIRWKQDQVPFDMSIESRMMDTNFVHGIAKEQHGAHMNFLMSSIYEQLILKGYFEKEVISAIMELAKDDLYKVIGTYEDKKISENGDVYFESLKNWYEREGLDNDGEKI